MPTNQNRKSNAAATPASARPLRLEYLDPGDLGKNPANWRFHPPSQLDAIETTIGEVGWAGALLYNERTGHLLDGHGRKERYAGKGPVPVLIGSWDEPTEKKILALYDSLGAMAIADGAKLSALVDEVSGGEGAIASMLGQLTESLQSIYATTSVAVVDLKFHPRNYKQHPDDQLAHIMASIEAHGFYRNVVLARDLTVLAGQGVVQAAVKLGRARIPAIVLDLDPNEPRALKVLVSDNEIGKFGETDDRALTELLRHIMESDPDALDGTGYDAQQLAALVFTTRPETEIRDKNAAAEWIGLPEYEPFDAPIRLVVSFDSAEDRERLMQIIGVATIQKKSSGAGASSTWSIKWPDRARRDLYSLKFADVSDAAPAAADAAEKGGAS